MEKDQLCFPSLHAYAPASIRPFALYKICNLYRSENWALEAEVNYTIFLPGKEERIMLISFGTKILVRQVD